MLIDVARNGDFRRSVGIGRQRRLKPGYGLRGHLENMKCFRSPCASSNLASGRHAKLIRLHVARAV